MEDTNNQAITKGRSHVDRARRFRFVANVVTFCLVMSGLLVVAVGFGTMVLGALLIELYVKALLSLATAISLAYIGGSVVDYNGGFGNMFTKKDSTPKG